MKHTSAILLVLLTAAACKSATGTAADIGVSAPGARASITYELLQVAGGTPRATLVVFDSAAMSFEERICIGGADATNCSAPQQRSGPAGTPYLKDAFALATSNDARGLKEQYDIEGVRPPDVFQYTVTVVANERRYRVTWDGRGKVPAILPRLVCRLDLARGLLIVCAS